MPGLERVRGKPPAHLDFLTRGFKQRSGKAPCKEPASTCPHLPAGPAVGAPFCWALWLMWSRNLASASSSSCSRGSQV